MTVMGNVHIAIIRKIISLMLIHHSHAIYVTYNNVLYANHYNNAIYVIFRIILY